MTSFKGPQVGLKSLVSVGGTQLLYMGFMLHDLSHWGNPIFLSTNKAVPAPHCIMWLSLLTLCFSFNYICRTFFTIPTAINKYKNYLVSVANVGLLAHPWCHLACMRTLGRLPVCVPMYLTVST